MDRKTLGIGIVIGLVIGFALAIAAGYLSPSTSARIGLVRYSTVTMPVFAGVKTVTVPTTTTLTKYLGGKVVTVTRTETQTSTVTQTRTVLPKLLTTTISGTAVPLWYSLNGGVGYAGEIKLHNHTLYIMIKTVTKVYKKYVGSAITVPKEGFLVYPYAVLPPPGGKPYAKYIDALLSNAKIVIAVGTPPPQSMIPEIVTAPKAGVILSLRACESYLTAEAIWARTYMGSSASGIKQMLLGTIRIWKREMGSINVPTLYCTAVHIINRMLTPSVSFVVITDKYVIILTSYFSDYCRARSCAVVPLAIVGTTQYVLNLTKLTGVYEELASALEQHGIYDYFAGCINPMSPSKFWEKLETFASNIAQAIGNS